MPVVKMGKVVKHFPYTVAGKKAAKKMEGMKMEMMKSKKKVGGKMMKKGLMAKSSMLY